MNTSHATQVEPALASRRPGHRRADPEAVTFDRETRVLLVLSDQPVRHGDVPRLARMDPSTCALVLRRLLAHRLVDVDAQPRGAGGGSGAPSFVWTLTADGHARQHALHALRGSR